MYTTAEVLLYKTMKLHANNNSLEDKALEASKKTSATSAKFISTRYSEGEKRTREHQKISHVIKTNV